MAGKNRDVEPETPRTSTENPETLTESPETPAKIHSARRERDAVAYPRSPVREVLTPEVLAEELKTMGSEEIGNKYGCGGSLVRALIKQYGLKYSRSRGATGSEGNVPVAISTASRDQAQIASGTSEPAVKAHHEEPISSGLNLSARGIYTADRLHRILAGVMAAIQEAGGEFSAHIEVRGRDSGG